MVNFKHLILEDSKKTTFINLGYVKTWSLDVAEISRDAESTTFTIKVTVDDVEYTATHKLGGCQSTEVYLQLIDRVLDGVNSPQFIGIKYDTLNDNSTALRLKMTYVCKEFIISYPLNYSEISLKPKRPNKNRSKDVFDEVEFEGIED